MTQLDSLLQAVCKTPQDAAARGAFADSLREAGEPELAHAVEADMGASLLGETSIYSKSLRLPLSVHLLWFANNIVPRVPHVSSLPQLTMGGSGTFVSSNNWPFW